MRSHPSLPTPNPTQQPANLKIIDKFQSIKFVNELHKYKCFMPVRLVCSEDV